MVAPRALRLLLSLAVLGPSAAALASTGTAPAVRDTREAHVARHTASSWTHARTTLAPTRMGAAPIVAAPAPDCATPTLGAHRHLLAMREPAAPRCDRAATLTMPLGGPLPVSGPPGVFSGLDALTHQVSTVTIANREYQWQPTMVHGDPGLAMTGTF